MAPALLDGLYNLAAPRQGGSELCAALAYDKHELEWLATQEVPGRSKRLKEMIDLARRVEEHETAIFKLHLDEEQTSMSAEAVFELGMVIKDTEKLVRKKETAFAKVAHVWAHRKEGEHERGWNAAFEQAADNQYINLELCRARLRGLKKLAPLYRRMSLPPRASSHTLYVPGSGPDSRRRSQTLADPALEDDEAKSASGRSSTPIPRARDPPSLDLRAYTPGPRTETVEAPQAQPRRASEGARPPSTASSPPASPSPPTDFALAAAVAASSSLTAPGPRAPRTRLARDTVRGMSRRIFGGRE